MCTRGPKIQLIKCTQSFLVQWEPFYSIAPSCAKANQLFKYVTCVYVQKPDWQWTVYALQCILVKISWHINFVGTLISSFFATIWYPQTLGSNVENPCLRTKNETSVFEDPFSLLEWLILEKYRSRNFKISRKFKYVYSLQGIATRKGWHPPILLLIHIFSIKNTGLSPLSVERNDHVLIHTLRTTREWVKGDFLWHESVVRWRACIFN